MISLPCGLSTSRYHMRAILNQPRATACQSTHPLGMRHVFPRHRIWTASSLTLLHRCHQSSPYSVFVRLFGPTQPNVSTTTMLHLTPYQPPEHHCALFDAFGYMIFTTYSHIAIPKEPLHCLGISPIQLPHSPCATSKTDQKYSVQTTDL
jgi:hypothetical protein